MLQTTCPSRDELNLLLLGKLPPAQTSALADHLEICLQCQAETGTIESPSDTLLSAIHRADKPTIFEQESALGRAIEQIKQFGLPPVDDSPYHNVVKVVSVGFVCSPQGAFGLHWVVST